jgi:prophage DNA circulation protein
MLRDSLLCTVHSTGEGALVNPEYGGVVVNVTTAMSEYDECHGVLVEAFIDDSSAR